MNWTRVEHDRKLNVWGVDKKYELDKGDGLLGKKYSQLRSKWAFMSTKHLICFSSYYTISSVPGVRDLESS